VLAVLGCVPNKALRFVYPVVFVFLIAWMFRHFVRGDFVVRFFKQESAFVIKLCLPFFLAGCVALYGWERFIHIKVGLLLVALAIYLGRAHDPGFRWAWVVYSVAVAYLCLGMALGTHSWLRPLTQTGDYSYGLYLWAYPVQQTLLYVNPTMHMLLYLILCLVLTFALAMLSWHLIERPTQAYKHSNPLRFFKLPTYR
jgi:peptidoglycan/LPS O-acetylase OafA/YrhL